MLGDDVLGYRLRRSIADQGVDTRWVSCDPNAPTGVYFKDPGHGVFYYRRGSAASRMDPATVAGVPLEDAAMVHLSGITPALSQSCADLVDKVFERVAASAASLSFDVNYRPSLWPEGAAAPTLRALANRADIIFVGLDEAQSLWGCTTAQDVRTVLPDPGRLIVKDSDVGATEFSAGTRCSNQQSPPKWSKLSAPATRSQQATFPQRFEVMLRGIGCARVTDARDLYCFRPATTSPTPPFPLQASQTRKPPSERTNQTMISNAQFSAMFAAAPLMAILRGIGTERSLAVASTAWDLGIDVVELPIQTPEDIEALKTVAAAARQRGKVVGAGTVVTAEQVRIASDSGAAFTVSPGFDLEVVRASSEAGMPPMPGVATATEVQLALKSGLTWLKAFPASVLGTSWIRAMHGPFPQAKIVTTGGMDAANAGEFLLAGARVAAVGSALEDRSKLPKLAALLENDDHRKSGAL
jgi:Entner-Doudoroff aldolase